MLAKYRQLVTSSEKLFHDFSMNHGYKSSLVGMGAGIACGIAKYNQSNYKGDIRIVKNLHFTGSQSGLAMSGGIAGLMIGAIAPGIPFLALTAGPAIAAGIAVGKTISSIQNNSK
jgi:hypothetical protein